MKILVAHRQKRTVDLIKSVLSSSNPVVLHTESGLDGLLTSRIEHFDVIICSTDLPVVTGFELVRSIRTNSINRNTPVIFITEELDEKTQHLSSALHATAVLSMSDIPFQLARVIENQIISVPERIWQNAEAKARVQQR